MAIETVINATVIWTAAPACPTPKTSGATDAKGPDAPGTRFRIRDVHSNNDQNRRALSPA